MSDFAIPSPRKARKRYGCWLCGALVGNSEEFDLAHHLLIRVARHDIQALSCISPEKRHLALRLICECAEIIDAHPESVAS